MKRRSRHECILTSLTIIATILLSIPVLASAPPNPALSKSAVTLERSDQVISSQARSYIDGLGTREVAVWVYFTDKGLRSGSALVGSAAALPLTDRARVRRAKVGMDEPVFADVPVNTQYISGVESVGASVRRTSRFLNAVSVNVSPDKLDALAALPYVRTITPMAKFKKDYPQSEMVRPDAPEASQSPDALNYGNAAQQLGQITVPAVHNKGYDGSGVTLAIFDTGFRKTHEAFANAYLEGRVLAEWDFIFNDGNVANEGIDDPSQWNHGTGCLAVAAGLKDGTMYGPAYKANIIMCKTEDVRSETPVEEDNWVAALEFVDSIGADVITSSLGYSDWYTYADYDGNTATITLAANTAAGLGIVHCNSMGNAGPGAGTLSAPADAFDMISVGAVSSTGAIASFSSRGPTADGRMKPEVCARGVSTYWATPSGNNTYGSANGTSLSTPLVAGAACLIIQAHPTWPPALVRLALMETASKATSADNTYGWGIINTDAALSWGASFNSDIQIGVAPLNVQFTDVSSVPATSVEWDFGDGNLSTDANPSHTYLTSGLYDVSLVRQTTYGPLSGERTSYILVHADSVKFGTDSVYAGQNGMVPISLTNTQPVPSMTLSFAVDSVDVKVIIDSILLGSRTSYFEATNYLQWQPDLGRFAIQLVANIGGGSPALTPGTGEVLRVFYHPIETALGGYGSPFDTAFYLGTRTILNSATANYEPIPVPGQVRTKYVRRSDMSLNDKVDLTDLSMLISYLTTLSPTPVTLQAADFNASFEIDLTDLSALISYLTGAGNPPVNP